MNPTPPEPNQNDPQPGDGALDEMTAALRDAGADQARTLPPELRRATLQALWAADAGRYERRYARNARLFRRLGAVAAAVLIVAAGWLVSQVVYQAWIRQDDPKVRWKYALRPPPPAATTRAAPVEREAPHSEGTGSTTALGAPTDPPVASVAGRVVFLGSPPKRDVVNLKGRDCAAIHPSITDDSLLVSDGGGLANVVVSASRVDGQPLSGPTPTGPAVLDQRGCQFIPHVLAVMVGQTITVTNSDPILHNVRSLSVDNPGFNFGQPAVAAGRPLPAMQAVERFTIKCDLHPWMAAHVSVFDHPYFAITDPRGAFAIPGKLPDGQYVLTAWHEKLGQKQATVTVKDGQAAATDFTFDASTLREE